MRNVILRRGLTTGQTVAIVVGIVIVLAIACLGAALLVRLLLPAMATARQAAQELRSTSQLRSFEQARIQSQIHFPDVEPTLDNRIANDYLIVEITDSPFGPAPDGRGDYWFLAERPEVGAADAARFIVGYDRAMYAGHRNVVVLFHNGAIEVVAVDEFDQLIAAPPNAGRDFDLPARR